MIPAGEKKKFKGKDPREDTITGTANILFVDDEDMICEMSSYILGELGYNVIFCYNGLNAVEHYRKSWKEIDLVILDITMPVMDGIEAFTEMRKINPKIKALIITGHLLQNKEQEILKLGPKGILYKPYRNVELSQLITKILDTDM